MKQILELDISLHCQLGPADKARWEDLIEALIEAGEPPEFVRESVDGANKDAANDEDAEEFRSVIEGAISELESVVNQLKASL